MSKRTAVVILNWNNRNFLEQFLPDVIKYSSEHAEVIVADNASTDDSLSFLEKNFSSIRIIKNETNLGYTGGYNSAIEKIDAEFVVLLNSDVKLTENWLLPLIQLMDKYPNAGACQPKLLSFESHGKFEYAGAAGGYIDKYGYPFCRGRIFNSIEEDEHQYDDTRSIFWASGACMMVRTKVFRELKGFDPIFFAHMEEIDLCWRMHHAGYGVYYCSSSTVYHVGGGTLPKSNPKKTYLNFRNNLIMIYKNTAKTRHWSLFVVRLFLDFIASIKFLISGSFLDFRAVWEARRDFRRLKSRYPRPFSDFSTSDIGTRIFIYPKSILLDYYLYRRKKFSSLKWSGTDKVDDLL